MNTGYMYDSPIGLLKIEESDKGICKVSFNQDIQDIKIEKTDLIIKTCKQLDEYFEGKRTTFTIPLDIQGTPFQVATWKALLTIPYGQTWSYKELASAIGNSKASRAVGNANNKNKIAILIPCHRVIGSNGKLVGYAGGLDKKEYLLDLERKMLL